MGASLLAIAVCQSTSMSNVLALSRAGSLPQGFSGVFKSGDFAVGDDPGAHRKTAGRPASPPGSMPCSKKS
ncbi:hypothetical protein DJ564_07915 [Pseudomonas sp. 31-12]|nr:hypothetical protein DJ564_07915 [Pseudomonas sp. 31-12]